MLGSIELRLRNIALGPPNTVAAAHWNQAVTAMRSADSTGRGNNIAHGVAADANSEKAKTAKETRQMTASVRGAASAASPSTRNAETQRRQQHQQQKAQLEPPPPQPPQPLPPQQLKPQQEHEYQQLLPLTASAASWQEDGHRSPHSRQNRSFDQIAPVAGAICISFSAVLLLAQ